MHSLPFIFTVLWVVSASYLGWRALVSLCRIKWARHADPNVEAPAPEAVDDSSMNWLGGPIIALGLVAQHPRHRSKRVATEGYLQTKARELVRRSV